MVLSHCYGAMSNVKAIQIEEGSLSYLGVLELESVTAEMKEGQWGEYQSGYVVEFRVIDTNARVSITVRKGTDWFDQLNAIRVLKPSNKSFTFTKNKDKSLIVSGVLQNA